MFRFGTLRVGLPLGSVILRAAAMLLLATLACEALVRIPLVQGQLLLPILPGHYEVGAKEYLAERLAATNGHIDCFFIGNSIVGRGINPQEFGQAYQAQTGQPITCFNFGVDTLTFTGAQRLTQILVRRYHPRLIIFGAHYEYFTTSDANAFDLNTPWARTQLGAFDPEGWLESNLLSYRDVLTYDRSADDVKLSQILTTILSPSGFRASDSVADPHILKPKDDPDFFAILDTINLDAHRPALDALLSMDTGGAQMVVVDMPLSTMTSRAIIHFGYDYQGYLNAVFQAAQAHQLVYIPMAPPSLIPDEGYEDDIHMNSSGAGIFSTWLGEQIGQMVQQGAIRGQ